MSISEEISQQLLAYQKNEITEHHICRRLARIVSSPENRRILENIADSVGLLEGRDGDSMSVGLQDVMAGEIVENLRNAEARPPSTDLLCIVIC